MLALGIPSGLELIIIVFPVFGLVAFTIYALVDILKHEFRGNDKIVWLLVVLFLSVIGVILYFLIGRNQRINRVS